MKHAQFDEFLNRFASRTSMLRRPRRSKEADIALLLVLGGCERVQLDFSGWSGYPLETSGYRDIKTSLTAYPYINHDDTNLLWSVLRKGNIPYSGAAGDSNPSYMQASWLSGAKVDIGYLPDVPLIVANFWTLKHLIDEKKIRLDY